MNAAAIDHDKRQWRDVANNSTTCVTAVNKRRNIRARCGSSIWRLRV